MTNEQMTDAWALDFIRAHLAPYAAHSEKDQVMEHITARLRGEEEANETAAIAAYEKYMGVSADDPAYGPDLTQWMAGWNAALAQDRASQENR